MSRFRQLLAELGPLFLTQKQLCDLYKVVSSPLLTEEVHRALQALNEFFEEEDADPGKFFRGFWVKAYSKRFDAFVLLPLHDVRPDGQDGKLVVELRVTNTDGTFVSSRLPASDLWPTRPEFQKRACQEPGTTLNDDDLHYVVAMTEINGYQYLFPAPAELTRLRKVLLHRLPELLGLRHRMERFRRVAQLAEEKRKKIEETKQELDLVRAGGQFRVPSAEEKNVTWGRIFKLEEEHRRVLSQADKAQVDGAELETKERQVEKLLRQFEDSVQTTMQEAAEAVEKFYSATAEAARREAAGYSPSVPRDPRRPHGTGGGGGGGGVGLAAAPWRSSPGAASAQQPEAGTFSNGAYDSPPPAKRLRTQHGEGGPGSPGGSTPRPSRLQALKAQLLEDGQVIPCEEDCAKAYAALVVEEEEEERQRQRQQEEQPSWKGKVALGVDGDVKATLTSGSMWSQPLPRHSGASSACASVISSIAGLRNIRIPLVFPQVAPIPDLNELIPEVGVLSFKDDKELDCMVTFARARNWYDSATNLVRHECGVSSVVLREGRFNNLMMTVFVFTCASSWAKQTLVPQLRDAHMQKQFLDNKAFLLLFRLVPAAPAIREPGCNDRPKGPVAVAGGGPAGSEAHIAAPVGSASASPGPMAAAPGPSTTAAAASAAAKAPAPGLAVHHQGPAHAIPTTGGSSPAPTAEVVGVPAAAAPQSGVLQPLTSPAAVLQAAGPPPGILQGAAPATAAAQPPESAATAAAPADGAGGSAAPVAATAPAAASVQQVASGLQAQPEAAAVQQPEGVVAAAAVAPADGAGGSAAPVAATAPAAASVQQAASGLQAHLEAAAAQQPGAGPALGAAAGWPPFSATYAGGAYPPPQYGTYYGTYWSSSGHAPHGTHAAFPAYTAPSALYQLPYDAAPYQHASRDDPSYQGYSGQGGYGGHGYGGYGAAHGYGVQAYVHWPPQPPASQQAYGYYAPSGHQAPALAPDPRAAAAAAAAPAVVAPVAAAAEPPPTTAAVAAVAVNAPWRDLDPEPAPAASGMSMSEGSDAGVVVGPARTDAGAACKGQEILGTVPVPAVGQVQPGPGSHVPPPQADGTPSAAVATPAAGVPPQEQSLEKAQHAPLRPPPSPPRPPPQSPSAVMAGQQYEREPSPPSTFSSSCSEADHPAGAPSQKQQLGEAQRGPPPPPPLQQPPPEAMAGRQYEREPSPPSTFSSSCSEEGSPARVLPQEQPIGEAQHAPLGPPPSPPLQQPPPGEAAAGESGREASPPAYFSDEEEMD